MRHWVGADDAPDFCFEFIVQNQSFAQPYEQNYPGITIPALPDDKTLDDLFDLLGLAIDFCGADANAARIEYGVERPYTTMPPLSVSST